MCKCIITNLCNKVSSDFILGMAFGGAIVGILYEIKIGNSRKATKQSNPKIIVESGKLKVQYFTDNSIEELLELSIDQKNVSINPIPPQENFIYPNVYMENKS